jgi:nitroimidazol reductase NimA-like FMN-containing flavoprotein (pyridoxamine 5'-phosphate oxidase superfamily)
VTGETPRTTPSRDADRVHRDRGAADRILAESLIGHVGALDPQGRPVVLPVAVAPDGDQVLFHGSTGSRMFRALASGGPMCLTITHVDGLVLARSAFESSMNYRCLVVLGTAQVLDGAQKERALRTLTDHLTPGRWDSLRPMRAKEVAATTVLALPLVEFSVKIREGGPEDPDDADWPVWAGSLPIRVSAGPAIPEPGSEQRMAPALPRALR